MRRPWCLINMLVTREIILLILISQSYVFIGHNFSVVCGVSTNYRIDEFVRHYEIVV